MNSLPESRQKQILSLLQIAETLSIQELAAELDVSQMTIHRDLNKLARHGLVIKVHGGVKLAAEEAPAIKSAVQDCNMCHQPISPRHAFLIDYPDGTKKSACCPHCGLLMLHGEGHPHITLATDFIYGHKINAIDASYLIGSQVTLCCVPSVLAFASAEDGERFQLGFGGALMNYQQARKHLRHTHGTAMS